MSFDFPLPRITSPEPEIQLEEMKSYIYRLVEQLNFAMSAIDTAAGAGAAELLSATASGGAAKDPAEEAYDTFNSIKSLIIKSADIVSSYYDQMQTRLRGDYVANSVFGTYRANTQNEINANSEAITQLYSAQQAITSDVSGVQNTLRNVQANIRTGILYTDGAGNPVYGLEVGQRNIVGGVETFNKYARFTANRLSFYDQNDTEVAYISDYKLYITNAQVTGGITVGRYVLETNKGLAFRWV